MVCAANLLLVWACCVLQADQKGGAVVCDGISCNFTDCVFRGNSAGAQGGAVYLPNGTMLASGTNFEYNQCAREGGAVYGMVSRVVMDACTLRGNQGINGGGLVLERCETLLDSGCVIISNTVSPACSCLTPSSSNAQHVHTELTSTDCQHPPLRTGNAGWWCPGAGGGAVAGCGFAPPQLCIR